MRSARVSLAVLAIAAGASTAPAAVIYDQINNPDTNSYVSQQFEAANAAFNCMIIDDFTVSSAVTVQSIDFPFVYFNGPGPTTTWHVALFSNSSPAGLTGDVADVNGVGGGEAAGTINLAVGNIPLAAGTYWLGIQGIMNFTPNGEVGITGRTVISGSEARFLNPGGGFGVGANTNLGTLAGAGQDRDMQFRVNGLVPAPSSLALLGLSGLVIGRRRR